MSDFSGQFHAFALFQAREMAQGRLPVWSPGSYAGTPFAADTQAAVFYLPRWLTILLSLPWGLSYHALTLEAIAHVWLAGIFTYAFAYAITRERLAALLGATAFGLGGYLTSYPILQLAILETITWLPLSLLLLRIGVSRAAPVPWLAGAGLVLGLSACAGHPQTFLHISYLTAAYYLFQTVRARWRWTWILGLGGLIAVVTLGTSAAAWLPALRFALRTVRSNVGYEFVSTGLPMLDYIQVLVPGVLSFWSPEYSGLAAIALVSFAWWGRDRNDRELAFWGIVALLAAWLALGDEGILFQLVYRIAPGFAMFRQQERLLGVFSFSCALLAAQGMAAWLRVDDAARRRLAWRAIGTLGCGLALSGLALAMSQGGISRPWLGIWLQQWVFLAIVFAFLWFGRRRSWQAWGLVILLGADLYVSTWKSVNRQPGSASIFWPQPSWIQQLKSDSPLRFDSHSLFYANVGEIYGIEDVRGISPLEPRVLRELDKLPIERRWQLLNVQYVLAHAPIPETRLTHVVEVTEGCIPDTPLRVNLYRVDAALPRAWMTYSARNVSDAANALKVLSDPAFDPRTEVVFHTPVAVELPDIQPNPSHLVKVERLSASALRIRVTTDAPGFLVISEWHYPGWQATLDGQRVPLYIADYALQAMAVPRGTHEIVLRFIPRDVIAGSLVSLIVLVVACLLALHRRFSVTLRPAMKLRDASSTQGTLPKGETEPPQPARQPIKAQHIGLCTLLVLVGFGLRMFRLGFQELRGDEAFSYLVSRQPFVQIIPELLRMGEATPPLNYLMMHIGMRLSGTSELVLRFLSLLPGVLFLPVMFQLGRQIKNDRLGLLLIGLAAASSSLVWMSQDARNQYTLAILFSALATLFLAKAVQRPRFRTWAAYAVSCALTVYGHYYGVFALCAHAICMLAVPSWRKHLKPWVLSCIASACLFMPWFAATLGRVWATGQFQTPGNPSLARYLADFGVDLAVGSSFGKPWARWIFLGAFVLVIIGARDLSKRQPGWAALLTAWLGGAALVIYLIRFTREMFNIFYIQVAAPAWWILVGAGLAALWQSRRRWPRFAAIASLAVLLLANALSLKHYYFDPQYGRSNGYRGVAQHIAAQAEPGDLFLAHFPDPCLDYYLETVPMPRTMQPATYRADPQKTEQALEKLAARYERIWFVPQHRSHWDPEDVVYRWLERHSLREQDATYRNLTVLAYRPIDRANKVLIPLNLSIGDWVQLDGALVQVNGMPIDPRVSSVIVAPGSEITVTLLWRARSRITDGYTVFVHLQGENGKLLAQHDGWPALGERPTWTWTPGDPVLDRHEFTVPQDITTHAASILVGLYHSQTLKRQVFLDGGDAARVIEVTFKLD